MVPSSGSPRADGSSFRKSNFRLRNRILVEKSGYSGKSNFRLPRTPEIPPLSSQKSTDIPALICRHIYIWCLVCRCRAVPQRFHALGGLLCDGHRNDEPFSNVGIFFDVEFRWRRTHDVTEDPVHRLSPAGRTDHAHVGLYFHIAQQNLTPLRQKRYATLRGPQRTNGSIEFL